MTEADEEKLFSEIDAVVEREKLGLPLERDRMSTRSSIDESPELAALDARMLSQLSREKLELMHGIEATRMAAAAAGTTMPTAKQLHEALTGPASQLPLSSASSSSSSSSSSASSSPSSSHGDAPPLRRAAEWGRLLLLLLAAAAEGAGSGAPALSELSSASSAW